MCAESKLSISLFNQSKQLLESLCLNKKGWFQQNQIVEVHDLILWFEIDLILWFETLWLESHTIPVLCFSNCETNLHAVFGIWLYWGTGPGTGLSLNNDKCLCIRELYPWGGTDLERGYGDVQPWRPPFHASSTARKDPISSKRVSSQDPLLRKFWNFSLNSLNFHPNFSSQAPKFGNFPLTSPPFQRQMSVRKPHTSEIWAAHPHLKKVSAPPRGCTLVSPHLTIAARISSVSFVQVYTRQLAVSSLSKGISSTLNFHKRISIDGTQTLNLLHQKQALYRLSYLDCLFISIQQFATLIILHLIFKKDYVYNNFNINIHNITTPQNHTEWYIWVILSIVIHANKWHTWDMQHAS